MNYFEKIELWGNSHHSRWIDILRICLGAFLCYMAIKFLMDMSLLIGLMGNDNMGMNSFSVVMLGQAVVIIHLMGGLLIFIGLHTRIACLAQIPILITALFLLNKSGVSITSSDLIITIVTLLLVIYFAVIGNGPWSFFNLWKEEKKKR